MEEDEVSSASGSGDEVSSAESTKAEALEPNEVIEAEIEAMQQKDMAFLERMAKFQRWATGGLGLC